jgi:F-type H+-transporting ATPase subunit b
MRRFSVIVLAAAALLVPRAAYAAKAEGGGDHKHEKHEPVKLQVEHRGADKKSKTDVFDMSKEADQKAFIDLVSKAEHPHITMEEKIDVFGLKKWDTGIYSIIVFVLVFFVLAKFAWKPMIQGLNEREEKIRSALDQAERVRKEAADQHALLTAQIHAGAAEVREKIEEARRDGQRLVEEMTAKAKGDIQAERDRLHREIHTAKDAAIEELWEKSVSLASKLSTAAIRRTLTADDHHRLLNETLAELKSAGSRTGAI